MACKPGDAGADDQHLGRLDRAGGGHQHGENFGRSLAGENDGLISGDVGLRGEGVHRLGACDPGQILQGQCSEALFRRHGDQGDIAMRRQKPGEKSAGVHLANLVLVGHADGEGDIGTCPGIGRDDCCSRGSICVVVVRGKDAGLGFDEHFDAGNEQSAQAPGTSATRVSPPVGFVGDEYLHAGLPWLPSLVLYRFTAKDAKDAKKGR